jgi:hypothetical protein
MAYTDIDKPTDYILILNFIQVIIQQTSNYWCWISHQI